MTTNDAVHLRGNIQLGVGRFSDPGPKPDNEDFLGLHRPDGPLLATKGIAAAIADGVSAASAAREASETAVVSFLNDYFATPESWTAKTAAQRILTAINRWLYSQGQGHSSAEKGCVTTFTGVVLKSRTAHVFHIGDSRLYRVRGGEAEQITRDHVARVSADTRYLSRAMGLAAHARFDYHSLPLESDDLLVLTTDGIHDVLAPAQLQALLVSEADPESLAARLGEAAAHGDDNRSALVLRIDALPTDDKDDVFGQLRDLPFPPALLPGQSLDGLEVEKILAESPRSQLYLVRDLHADGRPLVLKTPSVRYEDDPDYLERFALEEWIGLRTDSPNLVRVVRRETPRRFRYHTLEAVDGPTLAEWLEKQPRPPVHRVVEITRGIVAGVRALHRKETLHQDLKPDNIMLAPDGTVKIIDYGSCRIAGIGEISSPFERNDAPGTIDYSAPEYRLGATPNRRSDLFSIAAITYHLLSGGKHPYGERWRHARSMHDFLKLEYSPLNSHNPMVPLWMDSTLRKALSIRADSRHESMSEFVRFLSEPDPTLTTDTPLPLARRNPVLLWQLIALACFLAWVITLLIHRADS